MSLINMRIGGAGGASASIFAYGDQLQSTDTVYAEKGGKRINGVWKSEQTPNPAWHGLPDEYQEVEYLESTGEQWIDTLLTFVTCDKVVAEALFLDYENNNAANGIVLGGNAGWFAFGSYTTDIGLAAYYSTGSRAGATIPFDQNWHTYEVANGLQRIDDVSASNTALISDDTTSFWLFRRNTNYSSGKNFAKQRLKRCEMFLSEEKIRNFIPCYRISDHKPGMYDTVNDVFYVNQGTGADFLVGADVPQYKTGFAIEPIREYGTWVLTATHGGSTKTISVLVDAAKEFVVEVSS